MTGKSKKVYFQSKHVKCNKTYTSKSNSINWKIITIISSILALLVSIIVCYSKFSIKLFTNTMSTNEGGWIDDKLFEMESLDVGCDIPIIKYNEINWNKFNKEDLMSAPFILKGIFNRLQLVIYNNYSIILGFIEGKWDAKIKWTRDNFKKYYGNKNVKTGQTFFTYMYL